MAREYRLLSRPWAFATAVVGFAMLVIYVTLIMTQGGASFPSVLPWALTMAIAAFAALAAAEMADRRRARNLMVAAAVLFVLLGALSILSIGIGFLVPAVLAMMSVTQLSVTNKS